MCAASNADINSTRSRCTCMPSPKSQTPCSKRCVKDAEETCAALGFPYRVKQLCTGDIGFGSAITYDIEVWAPGCDEWLEVSSVSNVRDFQARRANIKYRPADGGKARLPAHAERLRARPAAHADRRDGKLSASRWLDRRARSAPPVDGRGGCNQKINKPKTLKVASASLVVLRATTLPRPNILLCGNDL